MTDEEIKAELTRAGERWVAHMKAKDEALKAKRERAARSVEVMRVWASAVFAVMVIALAVWVVQVVRG